MRCWSSLVAQGHKDTCSTDQIDERRTVESSSGLVEMRNQAQGLLRSVPMNPDEYHLSRRREEEHEKERVSRGTERRESCHVLLDTHKLVA